MAYNENPNAENLLEKEIEIIEQEMRQRRKSWLRSHMTAIYIVAGILIAVLVFFGIKWYNDSHSPINRLISASGKNLGSSFSFHVTAQKNAEVVMSYDGAVKIDPSDKTIYAAYDAAYSSYSYQNILYSSGKRYYKGNLYQNQWVVSECTERAQEFFDFYTDYRHGDFDGGSFLRFTGLNSVFSSTELESFLDTVKSRLSTDSAIAKITTLRADGYTSYHYDIDLKELLDLIRNRGASIFYTSPDYNRFVARLDANAENIDKALCTLDFTITSSGYLSDLKLCIQTQENTYTVHAEMDHFGEAEPKIPDEFFEAARLQKTE